MSNNLFGVKYFDWKTLNLRFTKYTQNIIIFIIKIFFIQNIYLKTNYIHKSIDT